MTFLTGRVQEETNQMEPVEDLHFLEWLEGVFANPKLLTEQDKALQVYYFQYMHSRRIAQAMSIIKRHINTGSQVVEVGSHGILLKYLYEQGLAQNFWGIQKSVNGWLKIEQGHFELSNTKTFDDEIQIISIEKAKQCTFDADMLISLEVLEHIDNPWEALIMWRNWLKKGGKVILSTPNPCSLNSIARILAGEHPLFYPCIHNDIGRPTHVREFTPRELKVLLKSAGWNILEDWSFNHANSADWNHSDLFRIKALNNQERRALQNTLFHCNELINKKLSSLEYNPREDYQLIVAVKDGTPDNKPPFPIYRDGRPW